MDKSNLIEKVKSGKYSHEQLIGWIQSLPGTYSGKRGPAEFKKGDVLMHPVFNHPYVLLEHRRGLWVCGLLTTEPTCSEILEPCDSRFFSESYFTKVIFTVTIPIGTWMNTYENLKQVRSITNQLKAIFK